MTRGIDLDVEPELDAEPEVITKADIAEETRKLFEFPSSDISWAEKMATDWTLRHFVDAEVARARVDVAAAKAEARRWREAFDRIYARLKKTDVVGATIERTRAPRR